MVNTDTFEWVELPSKGQCYPKTSPLRSGKVAVEYLTAKDENIINSPKAYKDRNLIDIILERKLVDKAINASSLVKGDRDAVVLWLRRTGYGDNFPVSVRSLADEEKVFSTNVDLSKIGYRDFDLIGDENGHFQYFMKNGDIIKFKYLGEGELDDVRKDIKEKEDNEQYNTLITDMMKFMTTSVNGCYDKVMIDTYIDNMPVYDAFLYRSFIQENVPGIDSIVNVNIQTEKGVETKTVFLQLDDSIFLNVE